MRRSLRRHLKKFMFVLTAVSALLLAAVVVTSAAEREHTFEKKAAVTQAQDNLEESAVRAAISSVVFDKSSDEVSRVAVAAQAPQEEKKEADPAEKKDDADSEDTDDEEDDEDWDDEDSWEEDEEEDEVRSNGDFNLTYKYENYYSSDELRYLGVIYEGDFRWTWYSQNVLPGGGLDIPGRHVDENGYICDENNRICLASSDLEWGTIVTTPFGKEGCVYDCGCASGTLDVYVDF